MLSRVAASLVLMMLLFAPSILAQTLIAGGPCPPGGGSFCPGNCLCG